MPWACLRRLMLTPAAAVTVRWRSKRTVKFQSQPLPVGSFGARPARGTPQAHRSTARSLPPIGSPPGFRPTSRSGMVHVGDGPPQDPPANATPPRHPSPLSRDHPLRGRKHSTTTVVPIQLVGDGARADGRTIVCYEVHSPRRQACLRSIDRQIPASNQSARATALAAMSVR